MSQPELNAPEARADRLLARLNGLAVLVGQAREEGRPPDEDNLFDLREAADEADGLASEDDLAGGRAERLADLSAVARHVAADLPGPPHAAPGRELLDQAIAAPGNGAVRSLLEDAAVERLIPLAEAHPEAWERGLADLRTAGAAAADVDRVRRAVSARRRRERRRQDPEAEPGSVRAFVDDDGDAVEPLDFARRKLRLPGLRRVVKRARRDAVYDLDLAADGLVEIGSSADLMNPRRVEAAVADATGVAIPYYGAKGFRTIASALLMIAELEDSGATPENVTRGWLARFVHERISANAAPTDLQDPEARADLLAIFAEAFTAGDGRTYVHAPSLERFVREALKQPNATRGSVSARLARLDFEPVQIEGPRNQRGAKVAKRRYWRSPADFDPAEED